MSQKNRLIRTIAVTLAGAFVSSASADFVTNDPRLPAPAHFTFDTTVFATPSGNFHIDSFFDIFTELERVPPPVFGTPPHIDSFFDVFTELSISHDQDPPVTLQMPTHCDISTQCVTDNGVTQTFDTEMLSMDLSGGPFMIRESPTLPSRGQTSITDIGGGLYRIDSFFDIFTELSLDGGQTWAPASSSMHLTGVPEPTTLGVLGAIAVLSLRRRA